MYGKILIRCKLVVCTGMHIGDSSAFSAIGAVDSQVVRDPFTGLPIVPGSSLKGKLRTLLARSISGDIQKMPKFDDDDERIKRLFGSSKPVRAARLQFSDCFVSNADAMRRVGITEVKAENGINRADGVANPRFIERVSRGTEFDVKIVYDIADETQVEEDFALLARGMKLLQLDYLGGHGTRGSGRVSLRKFDIKPFETEFDVLQLKTLFQEVEEYELLPV
ncbi:MAG: type III-A CRISPR-associated RAMP protein Csm3 [Clostridia bacterium]|nr:type III-A CRISPR-associated RAMP protein Csm3 [Clostridia bacterium]